MGKVAVVTGAANGIGRASALKFAREGVCGCYDRHQSGTQQDGKMSDLKWGKFLSCVGDVRDKDDHGENFINTVIRSLWQNRRAQQQCGIVVVKPLEDTKFEEIRRVAKVNIGGTFV